MSKKRKKYFVEYIEPQYDDLVYLDIKPGDVIDYLEIIEQVESDNGNKRWRCRCAACGKETIKKASYINRYHLQGKASCGCIIKNEKRSSAVVDMTGKRVGKLVVIKRVENDKDGHAQWLCQCDCGNTRIASGKVLRNGTKRSCGCLRSDVLNRRNYKHGLTGTRIYGIFNDMNRRINDPNRSEYDRYGGAGLGLYERWDKSKNPNAFPEFYEWAMTNGYNDNLSIDREKPWIGYYPWNCRWVDAFVQSNNRTNNRYIYDGEEPLTYGQFERKYKLTHGTVISRLDTGHSVDEVIYEAKNGVIVHKDKDGIERDKSGWQRLIRHYDQSLAIPYDVNMDNVYR